MPFHPLAPDVTHLKDDELYQKINELSSKMNTAWRLGSNDAVRQMQMILAHYQEEAGNRNRKKLEDMEKNGKDLNKLIDIKK
jgi:hypothetical protein